MYVLFINYMYSIITYINNIPPHPHCILLLHFALRTWFWGFRIVLLVKS